MKTSPSGHRYIIAYTVGHKLASNGSHFIYKSYILLDIASTGMEYDFEIYEYNLRNTSTKRYATIGKPKELCFFLISHRKIAEK